MLEPRRLATRAVATRMAATLGEAAGETVGYRMRLETRVSRRTRIEVVTEGVFTRMLQSDPALEGVAAVLFDEFHERSLHADTGLAFALDAQENLAPELRLLVMSATLDGAAVARLLGGAGARSWCGPRPRGGRPPPFCWGGGAPPARPAPRQKGRRAVCSGGGGGTGARPCPTGRARRWDATRPRSRRCARSSGRSRRPKA